MLELLAIFGLYRYLDRQLIKKNRPTKLAFLGPVLWVLFELIGGFVAAALGAKGGEVYTFAILGAVIGGVAALVIVAITPPLPLMCPSCEETFLRRGTEAVWRFTCESCATPLRIVNGVVKASRPIQKTWRTRKPTPE